MTTAPRTYRAALLRTVSPRVLGWELQWSVNRLEAEAEFCTSATTSPALWLSLLTQMRLWLSLIFNRSGETDVYASRQYDDEVPLNRSAARAGDRKAPAAHASYALGHILMRRYGFARFQQWLYR